MRKKVLALVLALVMVVAMLPTVAFAASGPTLVTIKVKGTDVTPTTLTNGVWLPTPISSFTDSGIEVTPKESATLAYAVNDQYSMTAENITETVLATELAKLSDTNNKLWIKAVKDGTTEIVGMSFAVMASDANSLAEILGNNASAAQNTVTLSDNVTVDKVVKVKFSDVETAVTLDLNGHSITGEIQGDKNTTGSIFSLEAGKLTITDNSQGTAKGSIKNTAAKDSADDSSAVQISNATLTVKGVTLSGGNNVVKISGKTAELDITGAIIKADNPEKDDAIAIKASNTPKLIINADPETGATEVHGKMTGMWADGSTISGGYYTDFNPNAVTGGKSIFESGYGFVPVDEGKQSIFTYKVGTVDPSNAEGYVDLGGDAKVYGSIDMLVKFYGSQKTIYVKKDATLTLAEFGDVVGGKYNDANTLTFQKATEAAGAIKLTINIQSMKVGMINYSGEQLTVDATITAADGYKKVDGESSPIKYDIDPASSTAVAEVTIDQGKYTYTVDSLGAMFREIQGKEATVKLLQDVSYGQQIKLGGDTKLTLDLNGHTYKYTGETAAFNVTGTETGAKAAEFKVTNSDEDNGGVLDCSKTDEAICVGDFTKKEITSAENKLTINAGVTVKGSVTVIDKGQLDVSGTIEAKGFAISGNGSRDGTTINIHNGAVLKSDNTTAIYHPQNGTLTIGDKDASGTKAPEITGVAGVVVRDGTVEVNDATITATGTGDIKVGDAKDPVPAGGIVLDKADGYNTAAENKVTVEKATVTAQEGQPSVTYTENGEVPNYSAQGEKKPTEHVEVKAGTYQSGEGKADPSMAPFISESTKGLTKEGEIDEVANIEELYLVDFGYVANKADLGNSASSWTSPNGFTYNASDWNDATFYWCFNRALKDQEEVTVKFAISEDNSYTDTCKGSTGNTSPRYASSFLNDTQNTNKAVVEVGDWIISSPDNKFTVSDGLKTAEVTLSRSVTDNMPVVTPANLGAGAEATEGSVKAQITKADNTRKEYTVAVEAENLHSHANANGDMGYWVGFAVKMPSTGGYNGFYYKFEGRDWLYSKPEQISENETGVAFYFADTANTEVQLVWTMDAEEGTKPVEGSADIITFHVDFTGVKHYVPTPVYPPVSGGTVTPSATVTTPAATNGSYTVSDKNAKAGDTVTITPKADEGYTVDTVVVTDKDGKDVTVTDNGDGTYTFTMPEKASQPVTVKVTFRKVAPSEKFTDVARDAWYAEAINYVVEKGLMDGTGETTFAPNDPTNRAMLVTILYRLEGKPAVTKGIPFSDVASGEWYSDAINWAAANEIVDGYGDDTFRPTRELTREEAATILYRYAAYKKYDVTTTDDLTGYTDAETVSTWADTAMSWAVGTELINGMTTTTLVPSGGAIRAQIAAILMRFCENVVK